MIPFVAIGPGPDYPAVADVELAVVYDFGNLTGTLSGGGGSGDALEATSQQILALLQGVMNGDNSAVLAELDSAAKLVLGSLAAQHFGAISNAGTATETYVATEFGQTFTVTHSGLESDGDRSEATRVAS